MPRAMIHPFSTTTTTTADTYGSTATKQDPSSRRFVDGVAVGVLWVGVGLKAFRLDGCLVI